MTPEVNNPEVSTSHTAGRCQLPARRGPPRVYEAFAVRFTLRLVDDELETAIGPFLPVGSMLLADATPGEEPCFSIRRSPVGSGWRLLKGRHILLKTGTLKVALRILRGELVNHIGSVAPDRIFVHAGAVGWNGRAIILPGQSLAGKSTLVAALVQAGATYYSDEIAVLDANGYLHPYARPLHMRRPGCLAQRSVTLAELAGPQAQPGRDPIPVGLIAYSQFRDAAPWNAEPLTPGNAILEGLSHTLTVRSDPPRALRTWARAVEAANCCKWTRGEADAAARRLLEALDRGTVPA